MSHFSVDHSWMFLVILDALNGVLGYSAFTRVGCQHV